MSRNVHDVREDCPICHWTKTIMKHDATAHEETFYVCKNCGTRFNEQTFNTYVKDRHGDKK